MLLTVSTTATDLGPATDLGYLLHKHPDRVQTFELSFGTATVLYPEATADRCTALLTLDVDPVRLARGRGRQSPDFSLAQYVNDRPYAASSLLGAALADVFGTARSGRCRSRQPLADAAIPLEIHLPVLPCRGGPALARRIFEPLGWTVDARPIPLDGGFPEWGDSRYLDLTLRGVVRLADALNQVYVLLPVLDESKHYWQADDEVDKLLRAGGDWLAAHPERDVVVRRYLGHRRALQQAALSRLAELGDDVDAALAPDATPDADEARVPLNTQRHQAVLAVLREAGAGSVIDLGCGSGAFLLGSLAREPSFTRLGGCDVSTRALTIAARRRERLLSGHQRERISLFQAALTYDDPRLAGYDAAVLMEVVEHVDLPRLPALERVVLGGARPELLVVTTPNADYNELYEGLGADLGGRRHADHRFEWRRAELAAWSDAVASTYGYTVTRHGIGEVDADRGAPTQLAVFRREVLHG